MTLNASSWTGRVYFLHLISQRRLYSLRHHGLLADFQTSQAPLHLGTAPGVLPLLKCFPSRDCQGSFWHFILASPKYLLQLRLLKTAPHLPQNSIILSHHICFDMKFDIKICIHLLTY